MSLHRTKHVHGQRRMQAFVAQPATPSSQSQNDVADEVVAICDERTRRQAVTDLGPSRFTAEQSRAETCERYLQDNPGAIETDLCLPEAGGASDSAAQYCISGPLSGLERQTLPFLPPRHRLDLSNLQQNCARGSQRDIDSPGLAELNLVPGRTRHVQHLGDLPNGCRRQSVRGQVHREQLDAGSGCFRDTDQGIESSRDAARTGPRLWLRLPRSTGPIPPTDETIYLREAPEPTRSQAYDLQLRIRNHLQQAIGDGPKARGATRLLSNRPISNTMSRKETQLGSFDRFMRNHRYRDSFSLLDWRNL